MAKRQSEKKVEKKRTSVDLTKENYDSLNSYSEHVGSTYGRVINYLIDLWLKLPLSIKKELADYCNLQIRILMDEMKSAGAFEKEELKRKQSKYQELAYFFTSGETAPDTALNMKKTYLKNGYVTYPSNWTVLNNNNPEDCMYAGCIEVDKGNRYFLFFSNQKNREDFDTDEIYDACIKEYPEFKNILNSQDASSRIGLYPIFEQDDPVLQSGYSSPYGCVIKRSAH